VCAYCGKSIPAHGLQTAPEPEQKKDKIGLIIAVVLILVIVVPIAIAATVYVYVSGMIGGVSHTNPTIFFSADYANNNVTVVSVSSSTIYWSNIEISGDYGEISGLPFVSAGDTITDCHGYIAIVYAPNNELITSFNFPD
jgi:FlaG/FlaF family flagellin (archaellin)